MKLCAGGLFLELSQIDHLPLFTGQVGGFQIGILHVVKGVHETQHAGAGFRGDTILGGHEFGHIAAPATGLGGDIVGGELRVRFEIAVH